MSLVCVRGHVKKLEVSQGRLARKLYVNFKLAFTSVSGFRGQGSEKEVVREGKLFILIEKGLY